MEISQLRYLVLLSDELNFTRAAERGNVAQPALSRQIRKLEDELGVPLVDRTTRRVTLTAAGRDLAERARRVLAELDEARLLASDAKQLLTGRLTIGMSQTLGPVNGPGLLGAFHRRHPGVELVLREDLSVHLADLVRRDELDVVLISGVDAAARRQLELHQLASEELMVVVARDHPLAGRDAVRIRELRDERFIAFPPGATIRATIERAAAQAGFAPNVAFECNQVTRTRALVRQGLAISVLPRSDTESLGPEIVAVPIRGKALPHEVFVAWRAGRRLAPAPREFLAALLRGDLD